MKTIILIHGIRGTHRGLGAVAKSLSRKYKVITPDLPGSGTRAELRNKTLDGYVDWLHEYINNLHLKQKPYLIGHSMGSMIVSHFAEKYPEDIQEKVVLMAPVFRPKKNQKLSNMSCNILLFFLRIMPQKWCYKFIGSKFLSYIISHYLTCDKTKQKEIDKLHFKYSGRFSSAKSIMADIGISMKQNTIIPKKKKIKLIVGDKDKLSSLELTRKYARRANVTLRIIPNCGHFINYESPQKVAEFISEYI